MCFEGSLIRNKGPWEFACLCLGQPFLSSKIPRGQGHGKEAVGS
jgi:hypothetical protein